MNELRVIIRNNADTDGITESVINELSNKFRVTASYVLDMGIEERTKNPKTIYMPGMIITRHDCSEFHKPCKPLSREVINAMIPYKSMALHTMIRESGYDIYERGYLENVYYRMLKYWNDFLDSNRINCLIFFVFPHHSSEFILYALSQVKRLNCVMLYPQINSGGLIYGLGNSIETMGNSIQREYERIKDEPFVFDNLSGFMKQAIANINNARMMQSDNSKRAINTRKSIETEFISPYKVLEDVKHIIRRAPFKKSLHIEDKILFQESSRKLHYRFKALKYELRMDHKRDCKKYSIIPDINEKFVYYALHVQPEASSMPFAGEFKNQFLALEMLAEATKELGIKVYVKEHWTQYHRDPGFYERIAKMENVYLVDSTVNSLNLMDNCICVATLTGNSLFEALVKHKPALAFSDNYLFKGAPNIYTPLDVDDLVEFLRRVVNGQIIITDQQVINYTRAVERYTVFGYTDSVNNETTIYYNKDESAKRIVSYLVESCTVF